MFLPVRVASIAIAIFLCIGGQMVAGGFSAFTQLLIVLAGLYVTLAVSLNLINGITGQFSIGHAAFYMIGAYAAGVLSRSFFATVGAPWYIWLVIVTIGSALVAAIAGFLVGLPSLRLRGDYLAIVTLGFGEIISIVAKNQESLGKAYGMQVEPRFLPQIMIAPVWILAIICIAVCRNLLKTSHGLSFLAVREDEVASSAMGVNVTRNKVTAFVLGSAFAGAAGAMYGHSLGFISPANFSMDVSFIILTMVVLGGTGSITGSVVAAMLLFYIPEKMRDVTNIPMASFVAALIVIVFAVAAIKRLADHYFGPPVRKAMYICATLIASGIAVFVLGLVFKQVPALAGSIEGAKLRMVVFAITLVILMLLRPQGMFAHHEFSWSWVKRLFGKSAPTKEVAA